jgi:hypothetical protein
MVLLEEQLAAPLPLFSNSFIESASKMWVWAPPPRSRIGWKIT